MRIKLLAALFIAAVAITARAAVPSQGDFSGTYFRTSSLPISLVGNLTNWAKLTTNSTGGGGIAGTVIASGTPSTGDVARAADTSGTNLVWGTTLSLTALTNTALTASRAVVSAADKSLASSATTSTELGYVSGVTSAIQTQLDGKLTPSGTPISGALLMANGTGGLSGTWSQIVVTNGGTNVYLPGSVGIGTSTPNYPGGYFYPGKFLMIRDSFQAGLLLDADSYAEINWISRGNQPNRTTYALGMVPGDGMVSFRSATDTGLLMEYVMSFSTNRVGIGVGTTFPTTRLQVKGDFVNDLGQLHVLGNNYGYIAVDTAQADTNQYTSGIFFKQNGVVNWQYYTKGGDLIWHRTSGGVNEKMRLTVAGNLGIGTVSPTSTLHVAGSLGHSIATGSAATLSGTNEVYLLNVDAQTVTLPTAVGISGRTYTIKAISPCTTGTVATTSSQLIDGASTYSLSASNKFVRVISDNAAWWVIGNN